MKKNLFKLSSLLLVSLIALTSCEEDRIVYSGGDFVTFNEARSTTLSHSEAAGILEIPVNLTMPQANDVVVNFTVTSDNAEAGTDYNLLTAGSVTIPAGQTSAPIRIEAIDNAEFNESSILNVTLTSVSVPGIGVGITDQGSYYKRVVITNDDCPSQFMNWFGSLDLYDVGLEHYPGTGSSNEDGDCDVLAVTGDVAGGGIVPPAPINFFFVPDFDGSTTGTITVPAQTYCVNCSGGMNANYSGSGTYDATTNTILIDYSLVRTDGALFWTGQLEVTPN